MQAGNKRISAAAACQSAQSIVVGHCVAGKNTRTRMPAAMSILQFAGIVASTPPETLQGQLVRRIGRLSILSERFAVNRGR